MASESVRKAHYRKAKDCMKAVGVYLTNSNGPYSEVMYRERVYAILDNVWKELSKIKNYE